MKDISDFPIVMNGRQSAKLLGLSEKTLYYYASIGEIPHKKVGRRLLFSREKLLQWLEDDQAKLKYYPFGTVVDNRRIKTAIGRR